METALLALVVLLQVVLIVLLAGARKKRSGSEGLAERIEERIRQLEQDTGERMETACDAGREELLVLVGSLRASIEELALAVGSRVEPPAPDAPAVSPVEELRPLFRELAESMDARLCGIADLIARGGGVSEEDALARALQGRGYERVTYVDRPRREGSRLVAIIEARRAGMTYKGRVALEEGEIVVEDLAPMHRMFP